MKIIGRNEEKRLLQDCQFSHRPEFLAVYGRRRVGKTYLIRQFFNDQFTFFASGVPGEDMGVQLKTFHEYLREYGDVSEKPPGSWLEAFSRLKAFLKSEKAVRDPYSDKLIVFLDELPWMDTPKSDFRSALDYFWNGWGSTRDDLLFIVCGSAASWMIDHLLSDTGGFYHRVTRVLYLQPFSLRECEELYALNDLILTRQQMVDSYMVFGGVPFYLNCFDKRMSLAQNIDALCFRERGQLYYEYERMFRSLFRKPEYHMQVVEILAKKKAGMTRKEITDQIRFGSGETLSRVLRELEQSGFIRKYSDYTRTSRGAVYQIVDPFTLFSLDLMRDGKVKSWLTYMNTPGYYAWSGLSFELVCLLHIQQIKQGLGIPAIESTEYTWRSRNHKPGAQIDLVIDRADNVINLCEIKYTSGEYKITQAYEKELRNKLDAFREETGTKKALHITMITANGLAGSRQSGIVVNSITGEDLFL